MTKPSLTPHMDAYRKTAAEVRQMWANSPKLHGDLSSRLGLDVIDKVGELTAAALDDGMDRQELAHAFEEVMGNVFFNLCATIFGGNSKQIKENAITMAMTVLKDLMENFPDDLEPLAETKILKGDHKAGQA